MNDPADNAASDLGRNVDATTDSANFVNNGRDAGVAWGGATRVDPDNACVEDSVSDKETPVDLLFVVDRSGSLQCPRSSADEPCSSSEEGASATHWSLLTRAIGAFLDSNTNAGLNVGLTLFPRPCDCDGGSCLFRAESNVSCNADDYETPDIEIGALPASASSLDSLMAEEAPSGPSPVAAALSAGLDHAKLWSRGHPDHRVGVVLATDGLPRGCDQRTNSLEVAASVAMSVASGIASVPTYVLGVGDDPNALTGLNLVARLGGTGSAYLVDDSQPEQAATSLTSTVEGVRRHVLSCDYEIPKSKKGLIDYSAASVEVSIGSSGPPSLLAQVGDGGGCDPVSGGWYYDDPRTPTSISLCPATCGPLLAVPGSHFEVVMGCRSSSGGTSI